IMSITGEPDRDPMKIGFIAVDAVTGIALSQAILAGLFGRSRTGRGTRVEMSLLDVAMSLQAPNFMNYMATRILPQRVGNAAPLGAPAELFETADDPIILSAYFAEQWPVFCARLGLPPLASDPRFATNAERI